MNRNVALMLSNSHYVGVDPQILFEGFAKVEALARNAKVEDIGGPALVAEIRALFESLRRSVVERLSPTKGIPNCPYLLEELDLRRGLVPRRDRPSKFASGHAGAAWDHAYEAGWRGWVDLSQLERRTDCKLAYRQAFAAGERAFRRELETRNWTAAFLNGLSAGYCDLPKASPYQSKSQKQCRGQRKAHRDWLSGYETGQQEAAKDKGVGK